jgi:hypothetical protein
MSGFSIGSCLCHLIPCLVLTIVATAVILYFTGRLEQLSADVTSKFVDSDPFQGFTIENAARWDTTGYGEGGLRMELWNACEDRWTPYFDKAVGQWDAGSPDVLTLTTTRVDVDSSCQAVDGIIKVCNGNYGDNAWRGINEVLTQFDFIVSSVARMNDFYLDKESDEHRQMTMCHEVSISVQPSSSKCIFHYLSWLLLGNSSFRSGMDSGYLILMKILPIETWGTAWTTQTVPDRIKALMKLFSTS